jgi:phosphinothricin acetyltransferase
MEDGHIDPRIILAERGYACDVARIYAQYVTETPISFEEIPPTVDQMAHKIERTLETYPWLVALIGDVVAGYAYASAHRDRAAYRWSVDVSVYMDPRFHRRGIGTLLYRRLFEILRRQNFYNAFAGITLPNAGSVGLHEAMGFRPVGEYENVGYKFGRWHTTGWWQLNLQPWSAEPEEPIPFARILEEA